MNDMDYARKPKEVDNLVKAQNLKAASILLDKLYEQEVASNTPAVVGGYSDNKVGKCIDPTAVGRPSIDTTPPVDWPFSEGEWQQATQYGPFGLINKVAGYVLHERERQQRRHEALFEFGTSAVVPEQLERLRKTKEKQRKIANRDWRNRMKNQENTHPRLVGSVFTTAYGANCTASPYASLSDPYGDADLVLDNLYDDLMNTAVEANP